MTNSTMAKGYLSLALARANGLHVFFEAQSWPTVVREAQEAVELFLKAALRHVGIEPARTHDVAGALLANTSRFPDWFAARVPDLAGISSDLALRRGPAFYGDERRQIPPDQLFDRPDAERAMEQLASVRDLCSSLLGPGHGPGGETGGA